MGLLVVVECDENVDVLELYQLAVILDLLLNLEQKCFDTKKENKILFITFFKILYIKKFKK